MTTKGDRWKTFQRELRRRQCTALIVVAAYPTAVIAAAIGLAVAVSDEGVASGIVERVVLDLAVVSTLGWVGFVLALPSRRRRYNRTRWYEIAGNLAEAFVHSGRPVHFDQTRTIVEALSIAGEASHGTKVAAVIAEMNRGTSFTRSLQTAGCPNEICSAVADATSNRDLYERLEEISASYQEERLQRIERWRRLLQPLAVAAAGGVVLWIVAYIVIPVFTDRLYRWSGTF
jgi:hypothetical protein